MSGDFFRTRMGQTFYEATMPSLVRELARLNDNLERITTRLERPSANEAPARTHTTEEPR